MRASLATVAGCTVLAASCVTGALGQPEPEPARYPVAPGIHVDRSGCYVGDVPARTFRTPPRASIEEYRRAAAAPPAGGAQPSYHNLVTRLPLSVALYRAGRIAEARSEWRRMLSDQISYAKKYGTRMPPRPASVHLLAQRRLDALAEREMPGGWSGFYGTGAGQHIARGLLAVERRDDARAAAEWRCAAKASPEFELPHLMLGYVAALRGDIRTARREWIAALEGSQPGPGDMFMITDWQYDAMDALLHSF